MPSPRTLVALARRAAAMLFFATLVGASCGQDALALLPGVVNDPGNLTLRHAILRYGTARMCAEMQKRSMPLRMRGEDPATGRFFATSCRARGLGNGQLGVAFGGFGYLWTNVTGKLTFEAQGAIEYDTDFLMDGGAMYVYFREKQTSSARFSARVVERPQASLVAALPFGAGGQALGDAVGSAILRAEIAKGFTVVRRSNGSAEFGLGVVERGHHEDAAPFRVNDTSKPVLANDRSELHVGQRDFVGPFEVTDGARLLLNVAVDGTPAVDVLLFARGVGEVWLQQYELQASPTPPPAAPALDAQVVQGTVFKREIQVPAGLYYLVLDNTANAGRTQPAGGGQDDRAALVSYAVALSP
ncbi:MAG TPA: hypothetical protein VHB21_25975 [Minicystis sp.]|nr:hypothetical protein [Minicystis sp.]